jgi:hypothetical protein
MKQIRIAYFFEDVAHENFIRALVWRVYSERFSGGVRLKEDILNRQGGSVIENRFRAYMSKWKKKQDKDLEYDLIIVVRDQNCRGKAKTLKVFHDGSRRAEYPEHAIAYALPDPYIERWYLADPEGFRAAVKGRQAPDQLGYHHDKKHKDYYKDQVVAILQKNDITSLQAGAEYGDLIAQNINIQKVGSVDENFRDFIQSLQTR